MLFLAVLLALVAAVVAEYMIYKKHAFDSLKYKATFSAPEVVVGDDVYLYEEIRNEGRLPIPFIKIDTDLPDGLEFTLIETDRERGGKKVSSTQSIQSIFVLHSNSRVRRRWRVHARVRGEYHLPGVVVSVGDVLGLNTVSRRLEVSEDSRSSTVVLPLARYVTDADVSSRLLSGDILSALCPVTDPQMICGSREYTSFDPMNRINWKSTAVHGKLMVNIEERTVRRRFSVLLNMNSTGIEQRPQTPSAPELIERCITVCASLFDRIAADEMPARLFVNAPPPEDSSAELLSVEDRGDIAVYGPWRGRLQTIDILRTLARQPMQISLPPERMFDYIAASPELFGENENLVVISAYIDGRMLNFERVMRSRGINMIFYITSTRNEAGVIPGDVRVIFER